MSELLVHESVLGHLKQLPGRPWEVGGWLLGYWADKIAVVTHVTPPSKGSRLGITISGRRHRHRFDEAWDASEGRVTYLGDWHSHPGSPPSPSATDRNALRQLAADADYRTPTPLMAIISLPRLPRSKRLPKLAFYVRDGRGDVVPLEPVSFRGLPNFADSVPSWSWPGRLSGRSRA